MSVFGFREDPFRTRMCPKYTDAPFSMFSGP